MMRIKSTHNLQIKTRQRSWYQRQKPAYRVLEQPSLNRVQWSSFRKKTPAHKTLISFGVVALDFARCSPTWYIARKAFHSWWKVISVPLLLEITPRRSCTACESVGGQAELHTKTIFNENTLTNKAAKKLMPRRNKIMLTRPTKEPLSFCCFGLGCKVMVRIHAKVGHTKWSMTNE